MRVNGNRTIITLIFSNFDEGPEPPLKCTLLRVYYCGRMLVSNSFYVKFSFFEIRLETGNNTPGEWGFLTRGLRFRVGGKRFKSGFVVSIENNENRQISNCVPTGATETVLGTILSREITTGRTRRKIRLSATPVRKYFRNRLDSH